MKKIFFSVILTAFLFGCSEPKADIEKLKAASELVNQGQFEEGLSQLDAMAKRSPNDIALKQSRIQGHLKYGAYFLYSDTLSKKTQYRDALREFRTVLKIDPDNKDAKEQSELIIGIYKQMGREIPTDEE